MDRTSRARAGLAVSAQHHRIDLPEVFRVDGLAIEADAKCGDDVVPVGMVGPLVELLNLKMREHPG